MSLNLHQNPPKSAAFRPSYLLCFVPKRTVINDAYIAIRLFCYAFESSHFRTILDTIRCCLLATHSANGQIAANECLFFDFFGLGFGQLH
jgi:hypothetical protein